MMLLVIRASSPAVLTKIPVSWPGLVSEKPSMVTFAAWIVIMPVTVDSPKANVRPAMGFPAWAPLRVRDLLIVTFSGYAPIATWTVSLGKATLIACCMVIHGMSEFVQLFMKSLPVVATYRSAAMAAC